MDPTMAEYKAKQMPLAVFPQDESSKLLKQQRHTQERVLMSLLVTIQ